MADTATQTLIDLFRSYGLADLAPAILQIAADTTLTQAEALAKVYETPQYKARFPAMDQYRKDKTLGIHNEQDYMRQEESYLNVMRAAGLPSGFYDSHANIGQWMANSVSPDEIASRVRRAQQVLDTADPTLINTAKNYYGVDRDHLLAHVLDPNAAAPLIDKQMRSVQAGAAASRNNMQLDKAQAESLATDPYASGLFNNPYNPNAINDAFAKANAMSQQDTRLSAIEGKSYNQKDAIDANLRNDLTKQLESQKRAEREAARFSGSAGTASGSLGTTSGL